MRRRLDGEPYARTDFSVPQQRQMPYERGPLEAVPLPALRELLQFQALKARQMHDEAMRRLRLAA